jgi:UDP-N-acetylglucosamine--N-acetylmuramyl-(pentapeptide) pyrophosphoryl-undecaprenol N-acetylglucosamine transferase
MAYKILLVGGGTGGHIYPLVAVAEELKNSEIKFLGSGDLLKQVANEAGFETVLILSSKWRRYFSFQNFVDILKFPIGFFQAFYNVWHFMPDVIFAKGGYASLMPAVAGKLLAIPLIIHETDAVPGAVNKFLSRLSKKTFIAIESAKDYFKKTRDIQTIGNPIRSGILNGGDKNAALATFSLTANKPTVLITGAARGAKVINDIILVAIVELTKKFQVIHQTGPDNFEEIEKQIIKIIGEGKDSYGKTVAESYRVYPVLNLREMALAYAACDVIVSRAGSQIFETAAVGKPAIVIPLKNSAGNHQLSNAREFAKFGATVIEEDNLTPHILISEIQKVFENRAELSQKIKQFSKPDAANKIAQYLLGLA